MPHDMVPAFHGTLQSAAGATGNGTVFAVGGLSTVAAQVSGTFVGTVTWEGTVDGTNWVALSAANVATGTAATTATAPGVYLIAVAGLDLIRARISAYTSGAVTVIGTAAQGAGPASSTVNVGSIMVGAVDQGAPGGTPWPVADASSESTLTAILAALVAGGRLDLDVSALSSAISGGASLSDIVTTLSNLGVTANVTVAGQTGVPSPENSSTVALPANGVFTGTAISSLTAEAVSATSYSDVAGTLVIEQSNDGINWDVTDSLATTGSEPGVFPARVVSNYFRTLYINGPAAQSIFRLATTLYPTSAALPRRLDPEDGSLPVSQKPLEADVDTATVVQGDPGAVPWPVTERHVSDTAPLVARVVVGTTPLQISASSVLLSTGVALKADDTNTGRIYQGYADTITPGTVAATDGFQLSAGDGKVCAVSDLNMVWLVASAADQSVYYEAG